MRAGITVSAERLANSATSATPSTTVVDVGTVDWGTDDRALPPETLARSLVEAYLAHDNLPYPCLHPQAVRAIVDQAYRNANFLRTRAFEAFTCYTILAIATAQVYKFKWKVLPDAETHHQRATAHLNTVLCEGGLKALQAMLLLCQFRLSSSTRAVRTSLGNRSSRCKF